MENTITEEDARRLSGPGLRAFSNIALEWELTPEDERTLLQVESPQTLTDWYANIGEDVDVLLDPATLMRLSAILGIYKALAIVFPHPDAALAWLKERHSSGLFKNSSPLAFMKDRDFVDGMMNVRRHLDARAAGNC